MKAKDKEALKHDEFTDVVWTSGAWVKKHQRPAIVMGSGVVLIILVAVWYVQSRAAAVDAEWQAIYDAEKSAMTPPADKDPVAAEKAAAEAAEKAVAALRRVSTEAQGTPAGSYALYRMATLLYDEKKYSEAANAYNELLKDPSAPDGMKKLARRSLAVCLEEGGKWMDAADVYRSMAAAAKGDEAAQSTWDLSRCLDRAGKMDEASKARAEVIKMAPVSNWADLAKASERLANAPPEPPPLLKAPEAGEAALDAPAVEGKAAEPAKAAAAPQAPAKEAPAAPKVEPSAEKAAVPQAAAQEPAKPEAPKKVDTKEPVAPK